MDRSKRETAERIEAIRRGDADAFEALARECAPRLFGFAVRLTGRRDEAEDLVQETLVRGLPALRRFEGRGALAAYLLRTLSNIWKNRLRSRSRSRISRWLRVGAVRDADAALEIDPPDASPSPEDRLVADGEAGRIRAAVVRLDPERRLTLLLREVEDLSYEEIAAIMGVPLGTVRSRLARARDDLRRMMDGTA